MNIKKLILLGMCMPYVLHAQTVGFDVIQMSGLSLPVPPPQYIAPNTFIVPTPQSVIKAPEQAPKASEQRNTTTVTSTTNGVTTTSTVTTDTPNQQLPSVDSLIQEIQLTEERGYVPQRNINTAIPANRMYADSFEIERQRSTTSSSACSDTFLTDLRLGSSGEEVRVMQAFLNRFEKTRVAQSGAGSLGNETTLFGELSEVAVMNFQAQYATEILTPLGLKEPTGIWGSSTRAQANALVCSL